MTSKACEKALKNTSWMTTDNVNITQVPPVEIPGPNVNTEELTADQGSIPKAPFEDEALPVTLPPEEQLKASNSPPRGTDYIKATSSDTTSDTPSLPACSSTISLSLMSSPSTSSSFSLSPFSNAESSTNFSSSISTSISISLTSTTTATTHPQSIQLTAHEPFPPPPLIPLNIPRVPIFSLSSPSASPRTRTPPSLISSPVALSGDTCISPVKRASRSIHLEETMNATTSRAPVRMQGLKEKHLSNLKVIILDSKENETELRV
ncbi:hypothetical protein SK128_025011 [Halocaridina rubra]|uniref:Uncharacterized protein n=1 Tax=Halocaridina rubra TaxID=373956 RepID=A0AAN8ZWX1_HALRR